jgi:hypothetical protein
MKHFTCTTEKNANQDLFSCMSDDFNDKELSEESITTAFN